MLAVFVDCLDGFVVMVDDDFEVVDFGVSVTAVVSASVCPPCLARLLSVGAMM